MNAAVSENLPGLLGHELRNPLASAVTGAMLAREMVDAGDPRAAVLDGVLRDLDRMTGLIDGWLAIARDDRDEAPRATDLEALLSTVARRHRAELVSCPPSLAVRGDRAMLERAFDNLCENARKAGAANLRVAAQHRDGEVWIHVEDDGCGVAPEHADHVFDAGWSCSGSTGLGLFAVRSIVAQSDGEIRCVPLENGTRFTVRLPRSEAASR